MKKILIMIAFTFVLTGCVTKPAVNDNANQPANAVENAIDPAQAEETVDNEVIEKELMEVFENPGSYEDYSAQFLSNEINNDKQIVLFFHSKICGSCKLLDRKIDDDPGAIPENVSIIKVDFESEKELGKQYDVNSYHTLVYLDADGNELSRQARNTLTLQKLISNLPK